MAVRLNTETSFCTFGSYFEFLHDNKSINTFRAYSIVFFRTKHICADTNNLIMACCEQYALISYSVTAAVMVICSKNFSEDFF